MKKKIKFILRVVLYSFEILSSLFCLFVIGSSRSLNWALVVMLFTSFCCIYSLCYMAGSSLYELKKMIKEKK